LSTIVKTNALYPESGAWKALFTLSPSLCSKRATACLTSPAGLIAYHSNDTKPCVFVKLVYA